MPPFLAMTGLVLDLRSALRRVSRQRNAALVAFTSLGVGIGASVAIGTVANAVLIRPLPYERPGQLVMVWRQGTGPQPLEAFWGSRRSSRFLSTPAMVLHWREQSLPFEDFAVLESWETGWSARVDLIAGDRIERLRGTLTTPNLFRLLGVQPALGRTFVENERDVILLSDRTWRLRFGGDPGIVGHPLTIVAGRHRERRRAEVIGIMPPAFHLDYPEETEIWLPLSWSAIAAEFQDGLSYRIVARLHPDVARSAAEAAMQPLRPATDRRREVRIRLESMHDYAVGQSRRALSLAAVLTLIVFLSGALGSSTVFAATTMARAREFAVRRALGASPRSVAGNILLEVGIVAILAGTVGAVTVAAALPALRRALPASLPRVNEISVDLTTLLAVAVAVFGSTLLAGWIPVFLAFDSYNRSSLVRTDGPAVTRSDRRLRTVVYGAQCALVSALLIAGVIFTRSFWNITHVDKGFEAADHVYAAEIRPMSPAYTEAVLARHEQELRRRVSDLPHVEAVSTTSSLPLAGPDAVDRLRRPDGELLYANVRHVDTSYADVLGLRIVAGRWFSEMDTNQREWAAVISQSLADALYPGENAVGRLLQGQSGSRIIGVVNDLRSRSLVERPLPTYYWPRSLQTTGRFWLVVRSRAHEATVVADLSGALAAVFPDHPVPRFTTLSRVVADSVAEPRAYAIMSVVFAGVMLLAAAMGVYGYVSQFLAERTRDFAIRSAIGATPSHVVRMLVLQLAPPLLLGVSTAIGAVALLFPLLSPYVFEINRVDPIASAICVLVVTTATATAATGPLRRMMRRSIGSLLR